MNQKNNILKTYSGSCPIFPLPNFVMFPAVGNEFIIFEPRYLDMINYINDKEKFITMALLKSGWESDYENAPKIYNIGTLGFVSEIEEIEDNKFKIILMGVDKVQINETEQTHSFRIGATTSLNEITTTTIEEGKCDILITRFYELLKNVDDTLPFDLFPNIEASLEMLVNLICMAMPIPVEEKQKLLELPEIGLRYEVLLQFIDGEIDINKEITDFIPIIPFDDSLN